MNAEPIRNVLLRPALLAQKNNFGDVRVRQLGASVLRARQRVSARMTTKHAKAMRGVFGRRADFKVFNSVVMLDAIQMVDLHARRNGAKKGFRNQPMDRAVYLLTPNAERHALVATRKTGLYDGAGSGCLPRFGPTDAPFIGCFVPRFKTEDRFPNFIHLSSPSDA